MLVTTCLYTLYGKKVKSPNEKVDFKGRSCKNLNKDIVENMLRNVDWATFANYDVDSCWNYLLQNIMDILENVCPKFFFTFAKNRPSWLTNDLINLMKERDRLLKVYQAGK